MPALQKHIYWAIPNASMLMPGRYGNIPEPQALRASLQYLSAAASPYLIAPCFSLSKLLHLPHRNHLLPQMILVAPDRAIPSSDRLVFTHHDVLRDLIEQSITSISPHPNFSTYGRICIYLKS